MQRSCDTQRSCDIYSSFQCSCIVISLKYCDMIGYFVDNSQSDQGSDYFWHKNFGSRCRDYDIMLCDIHFWYVAIDKTQMLT